MGILERSTTTESEDLIA